MDRYTTALATRDRAFVILAASIVLLAAGLRLIALDYHLPFTQESDAWLTVNPVMAALRGSFFDLFQHPEVYSLYGAVYRIAVWLVMVPYYLIRALRFGAGALPPDAETLPVAAVMTQRDVVVAGRLVSALCGIGTVLIVLDMGRRLFGRRVAAVAALLFAVAPVAVHHAPFAKEIGLLLVLANAALLCALRSLRGGRSAGYLWGSLLAGLAASTQQTGFVYVAAVLVIGLVIVVQAPSRLSLERWLLGWLLAGLGIFGGNPDLVLQTGSAVSELGWLLALAGRDWSGMLPSGWTQVWAFAPNLTGTWVFGMALLGWFLLLARARWDAILISAPSAIVVAQALLTRSRVVSYYLLVATPWLCILAAYLLVTFVSWLRAVLAAQSASATPLIRRAAARSQVVSSAVGALLLAFVLIEPIQGTYGFVAYRLSTPPEVAMGLWLERNLPLRVRVSVDAPFPSLGIGTARFAYPPAVSRVPGPHGVLSDQPLGFFERWGVRFLGYDPRTDDALVSSAPEAMEGRRAFLETLRQSWILAYKAGPFELYGQPLKRLEAESMTALPWQAAVPSVVPASFIVLSAPFEEVNRPEGRLFRVPYPVVAAYPSDGPTEFRSTLMMYENGLPLGPAHSSVIDIASHGFGLFLHWEQQGVLFATSDNSNPNTNRRQYAMTVGEAGVVLPPAAKLRYSWPIPAGRYSVAIRASVLTPGASGALAVSFDDQPATPITIAGAQAEDDRVPLSVEASHAVAFELANTSGALLWIDYAELEPS